MMSSSKTTPPNNLDNLPDELKTFDKWVGWNITKFPINVRIGNKAEVDNPSTWSPFEVVRETVLSGKYKGAGFVLTEEDPYTIIDLDHVIDPETGEILPWAQDIIDRMDSYTEVSQSGTGIHIIIKGKKSSNRCRRNNVEIYDKGRHFALTGNLWRDRGTIENRQTELEWLCEQTLGESSQRVEPDEPIAAGSRDTIMTSVLGAARRAGANEEEFESLASKMLDRCEQLPGDEKTEKDAHRIAKSVSHYPPALSTHLTDTGNAEYMAKLYGYIVFYDHSQKRWLVWNGNYYQPGS